MTITRRNLIALLIAALAILGVAASCEEGGMYQGGGDSAPHYR